MARRVEASKSASKKQIGWREWIAFPELGIERVKAKMDTGARTSALHVEAVELELDEDEQWIGFKVLPKPGGILRPCRARVLDERDIKNTSGIKERRYVIETRVAIGEHSWKIELSLANRELMGFDVILGRTAIKSRGLLVNSGRSFLLSSLTPPRAGPA